MRDLIESFDNDMGLAVQHVARTLPKYLELCYFVVAEMRGKRQS